MARETLEIYAPLAHRLGMNTIKWELEDLAFSTLHPKVYDEIVRLVAERAPARDEFLDRRGRPGPGRPQGRQDQGHRHRPAQALLLDLPEDDRARPRLRRHLRPGRHPHPGRVDARLLRRARRAARALEPAARAVQGLRGDAEVQHVPVAAHHGDRAGGQAGRAADPYLLDAPPGRVRRGGALEVQGASAAPDRHRRAADARRGRAPARTPAPARWRGSSRSSTGSRRPPTPATSSTRCASRSTPPRSTCSPRAATCSRCPPGRRRSTSRTRCTPRSATAASVPGSTAGWCRWRARSTTATWSRCSRRRRRVPARAGTGWRSSRARGRAARSGSGSPRSAARRRSSGARSRSPGCCARRGCRCSGC